MSQVKDIARVEAPGLEDVKLPILIFCREARSKEEIFNFIQVAQKPYYFKKYITPLVTSRFLAFTIGHAPNSVHQKYIITKKGLAYLKVLA